MKSPSALLRPPHSGRGICVYRIVAEVIPECCCFLPNSRPDEHVQRLSSCFAFPVLESTNSTLWSMIWVVAEHPSG